MKRSVQQPVHFYSYRVYVTTTGTATTTPQINDLIG